MKAWGNSVVVQAIFFNRLSTISSRRKDLKSLLQEILKTNPFIAFLGRLSEVLLVAVPEGNRCVLIAMD
jgi:hypothetical protein